ncbi:unnamed protein product [Didymodactylos carnosus]|uniref:Uncharacterized protein n=1 Tax=Didymodactylos carnosus TaxID=1234261 RepID=A0A814G8I2_9BILA|nr:unnamed protein product [Didymodactylos carnosus]CAF3762444.1 unnamed protein product [Didymodactylos carnosus]
MCQLDNRFKAASGYGCYYISEEQVACTCPNDHYVMNRPCRVCDREDFCGSLDVLCAEGNTSLLNAYFACACLNGQTLMGNPCDGVQQTSTSTSTTTLTTLTSHSNIMVSQSDITSTTGSETESDRNTSHLCFILTTTAKGSSGNPRTSKLRLTLVIVGSAIIGVGVIVTAFMMKRQIGYKNGRFMRKKRRYSLPSENRISVHGVA